jgi:hypothetical protein
MYVYIYIHTYIQTHTHIYIHIRIHTHQQSGLILVWRRSAIEEEDSAQEALGMQSKAQYTVANGVMNCSQCCHPAQNLLKKKKVFYSEFYTRAQTFEHLQ